ncbi:hypothetical protein PSOL_02310 [Candidatus Phytoplasma solani]
MSGVQWDCVITVIQNKIIKYSTLTMIFLANGTGPKMATTQKQKNIKNIKAKLFIKN